MKKVITLLMMLVAGMTASAQGEWATYHIEGDELKGIQEKDMMAYTVPGVGSFAISDFNEYQFALVCDDGLFNTYYDRVAGTNGLLINVGIYDESDHLVEKFNMWLDLRDNTSHKIVKTRNAGTMSNPIGQKGKVKKIFKALQEPSGYVRIVAERYNYTDFDIKISPYKE